MLPTFFVCWGDPRRTVSDALEGIVTKELDAVGYDLVELRRGGSRNRPVLDVRIDRRDGAPVTVDDCARASRAIEARLDGGDVIAERYRLEVSSPGVERPLRTVADFRRFVGKRVSVVAPDLGGRVEVTLVAVEGGVGAEVIVVRTAKGEERRLPLAGVSEARLAFHW
jgi:ribosome maturation factor RimP